MKNLFVLLLLSSFLVSCENDLGKKDPESNVNMYVNSSFNFVPINAQGDNLLQVSQPLTIEDFDIVLYDENNNPYNFYDPMLRHPKRIAITGEWRENDWVCIYLNGPEDVSNVSTTFLRIGNEVHAIKGEWEIIDEKTTTDYNSVGGMQFADVQKIWFDDVLVYNSTESIGLSHIAIEP